MSSRKTRTALTAAILGITAALTTPMFGQPDTRPADVAPATPPAATPETVELERSIVTGRTDATPYKAEDSTTAMKVPIPIADTPGSIQVVPRAVMEDQAAINLQDAYENISGVVQSGNTLNARREVSPFIRGFESFSLLRNGMRATTSGSIDLVNIERVEVLKGPASILYGTLDPGGALNFVTKRPLARPYYELKQQIGSYDLYRTTVDLTGPVNESLLYRFNGAYTNSGSFRDEIDLERTTLAPSLTWIINDRTDITFDFSYTRETVPYDTGIPFNFNDEPAVSDDTFMGNPDYDGREIEDIFASYQLSHRFNEVWSLRHQLQFHRADARNEAIRPRGVTDPDSDGIVTYRSRYQDEHQVDDEFQGVFDLLGEFKTGSIDHKLLIGLEAIYQESDFDRRRQNLPDVELNPGFNVAAPAPTGIATQNILAETFWTGLYVQDFMSFGEDGRLKVLLGGRFDYFEQTDERDGVSSPDVYESAFTGRAGVLYELTDWVSPYVSVSQSFEPQFPGTVDQGGNLLDPETGLQYEAGLKFELVEDRLLATVSVYQLTKDDVAVFDDALFNATGQEAYFPGVEERSQGIELDVAGAITPELSLIASYAYTDTEILENAGDPVQEGDRFGNVPLHTARLWLSYNMPRGTSLEGFGFGAGVRYVSDFTAQFDQSLVLDDYVTFDAGIWYRKKIDSGQVLKFQLNVENIFDEDYYVRASDRGIVHPGEPLTVIGSIGIEF